MDPDTTPSTSANFWKKNVTVFEEIGCQSVLSLLNVIENQRLVKVACCCQHQKFVDVEIGEDVGVELLCGCIVSMVHQQTSPRLCRAMWICTVPQHLML